MSEQKDQDYYRAWMSHHIVSRRGLFRGLLGAGKRAQQQVELESVRRAIGRPPQAVAECLFLALCTACGDCIAACPYGLIEIKDGAAALQIDFSACDTAKCNDCTTSCKTGALSPLILSDTALRPLFAKGCIGRGNNDCRLCERACSSHAIYFDDNAQPTFAESLCDGCGQCKTACYHGHISLVAGSPKLANLSER